MSALLAQIDKLISEHSAAFCGGVLGTYLIAIDDKIFEGLTLSDAVYAAWGYVCEKELSNA
jgi:hypothetical protein